MNKTTILLGLLLLSLNLTAQFNIVDNNCSISFVDISATGTNLNLSDDGEANITIPFDFTISGVSSNQLRVSNNGVVLFNRTSGDVVPNNGNLDTAMDPGFYVLWDDYSDNGDVYWEVQGTAPNRFVVIQWNNMHHYYSSVVTGDVTFELIIKENTNEFYYIYYDLDFGHTGYDNGNSATVGAVSPVEVMTVQTPLSTSCIHWESISYSNPVFNLTIDPACTYAANYRFFVDVNITDMGGASELTVEDNFGNSDTTTSTGTVSMGPYPSGTQVTITVKNTYYPQYSSSQGTTYTCPPENNECSGAVEVPVTSGCYPVEIGDNTNAHHSGISPPCGNYTGGDIWFKVRVPQSGTVTVKTMRYGNSNVMDVDLAVYEGDCNNLSPIACDQTNGPGNFAKVTVTNRTPGEFLYVQAWVPGNTVQGQFAICAAYPPPNDDCNGAVQITSLPYDLNHDDTRYMSGVTNNNGFITACGNGMNDGAWFFLNVPNLNGDVTVEVNVPFFDAEIAAYSGSCGNNQLQCIAYADDHIGTGNETLTFTPAQGGTYINIGNSSGNVDEAEDSFELHIYPALKVSTLSADEFTCYPNPAEDVLYFHASEPVRKMEIFNAEGKRILSRTFEKASGDWEVSRLKPGIYFLKVYLNDKTGTVRLIKK